MFQKLYSDVCCVVVVCVASLWTNISRLALIMSVTSVCCLFLIMSARLGAEKLQVEDDKYVPEGSIDREKLLPASTSLCVLLCVAPVLIDWWWV